MNLPENISVPETRALHLGPKGGWRVQLDGASLRISAGHGPIRYVPLAQLSRVISSDRVSWTTPALLACLGAGIPVIYVNTHGQPTGYCYGMHQRESALSGLLDETIDHPEWNSRYGQWFSAMEQQQIRKALLLAGLPMDRLDPNTARSRLFQACQRYAGPSASGILRLMHGKLASIALEALQAEFRMARHLAHPRPGLNFVRDFSQLMRWHCYRFLKTPNRRAQSAGSASAVRRQAAQLMEAGLSQLEDRMMVLLLRFEFWLRAWVQEVPDGD